MTKLARKVAIVSGAGRGIGRAIALKLASEGARVVVNDIDAEPAYDVVESIRQMGAEAVACVGNVTQPDFGGCFVKTAIDSYGALDIIVNNAGHNWGNVIQKMGDEQWQGMLDVHLTAPFRILRSAAEYLRAKANAEAEAGQEVFRKVVNISSISGLCGIAVQVNYAAAKAGIVGVTKALSKEWGRYKVNFNCVAFGLINTRPALSTTSENAAIDIEGRSIEVGVNQDMNATMHRIIPSGRPGTVDEAAGAVYLFCSPESNYISGEKIICSGGFNL